MTEADSPIIDLYASDVPLDPNGKHLPWLWVLLLPFVEDRRIIDAFLSCEAKMSEVEKARNVFGSSLLFIHESHPLKEVVINKLPYDCLENSKHNVGDLMQFSAAEGQGIAGTLSRPLSKWYAPLQQTVASPYQDKLLSHEDIRNNRVLCYAFQLPPCSQHESKLLDGLILSKPKLGLDDLTVSKFPRLNKGRFNIADMALKNSTNSNNNRNHILQLGGYDRDRTSYREPYEARQRSHAATTFSNPSAAYRASGGSVSSYDRGGGGGDAFGGSTGYPPAHIAQPRYGGSGFDSYNQTYSSQSYASAYPTSPYVPPGYGGMMSHMQPAAPPSLRATASPFYPSSSYHQQPQQSQYPPPGAHYDRNPVQV